MHNARLGGCVDEATAQLGYVETDPSGRYGRVSNIIISASISFLYVHRIIIILKKLPDRTNLENICMQGNLPYSRKINVDM